MNLNPYESPRPGEPFKESPLVGSDAVLRLLMEIRNDQRELLELQRAALQNAKPFRRFSLLAGFLPLVVMVVFLSFSMYLRTVLIPPRPAPPARPVPRAAPLPVP